MNPCYRSYFCLLFFLLPPVGALFAQRDGLTPQLGGTRQDSIPSGIMPLDTPVPMTYILIGDPDVLHILKDPFQWDDNKHFPLRFDEAHLGNYGSATRPLAPSIGGPIGFSTGWLQYDRYYLHHETFKYYNQDIPVSKIKHSQASQEDTYLTLDFGRSFAKGINFSVGYHRINQIGEFGHQRQKNTGFGIGVWHNSPSGKYDAFYNYISNAATAEENGGISAPELIGDTLTPDFFVPVYITGGLTNHKHRSFLTRQILHLLTDTSQFGMDIWLQGQFTTGLFKYVDTDISSSGDYYGALYLTDQRGIRQYTYLKEHQWSLGISLPWKSLHSTIHSSLRYRGITLEQEPTKRNINELYLDVRGAFQWVEPLKLKGQLSLGLGQAEGAFSFRAEGELKTGILGHLLGHWAIMARKPYMVESSLYVNQQRVYATALHNPFMNEVGVTWDLSKQKFQAGIRWIVFDNYIYFDDQSVPQQVDGSFSLRRFFVRKEFDLHWIGVRGNVIWQPDPREELAIPELLYAASLYGRIKIFNKKVTLMPGMDITRHDGYRGISYFPVTGSYHLTSGVPIPDYFRIDIGLGLHIQFIKAFVRFEDLVGAFEKRVLYQADYYPHYRGYLRLGIEAGFFN